MADTWGTPSPSKSAWEPQPTDWQTTPSWQPQPTDWQTTPAYQPSTTYWQTSTTYWQPPVSTTQWQPPPSSYTPSPVVSSTPSALPASSSIPLTSTLSRSTTSQISLPAVASSIESAILSKSSIKSSTTVKSSTTGLFGAHRKFSYQSIRFAALNLIRYTETSTPHITIFPLDKGHWIAIGVCGFVVLISLIGLAVFCCIRRRRRRPAAHQRIQSGHYQSGHYQKASRSNVGSAYGISEEIRRSHYTDDRTLYERRDSGSVPLLPDSFLAFPAPPSLRDSRTESLSFGSTSNRSSRQLLPNIPTRQIGNPISLLGSGSSFPELHSPSASPPALPSNIQPFNRRRADAVPSPFLHRLPGAVNISDGLKARTMTPVPVEYNKPTSNITKTRFRQKLRSKAAPRRLTRKKPQPAAPTTSESFQCAGEESDSDRTDTPSIYSQASAPLGATSLSRGGSVSSGTSNDDSSRLSVLFETEVPETTEYKEGDL